MFNTFMCSDPYTTSSSSIVAEEDEAPQIVTSSEETIANESITPVSNENANELVQEDVAAFDKNDFYNPFHTPVLEEVESSSRFQDLSNMHEYYGRHHSTDLWTKNHPLEQVIGDPSKPVMTRRRLHIDVETCMYALIVSTIIKEAMLDHSWIKSMQDELNQFKRLDVWELVERPVGKNIIAVKWLWKNKTDAKTRLEADRIFVAYAAHKNFRVYHIYVKTAFLNGPIERSFCTIELCFVGIEYQLADLFTKALSKEMFEYLVHMIDLQCMTPTELKRLAKLSS
ncbi:hypothetical protein Tco_1375493 [Tanacetum coccineum]